VTKSFSSTPSHKKRFMPWSREQFHERLETFKPSTWFDKPKLVNAVECAKRGWINTADDRLECWGGCGGVVIVRIDQGMDQSSPSQGGEQDTDNSGRSSDENVAAEDVEVDDLVPDLDVEGNVWPFFEIAGDRRVVRQELTFDCIFCVFSSGAQISCHVNVEPRHELPLERPPMRW